MKWKMWVIVTALAIGGAAWGATNDLSGLLQKGLFEEEANRNLDAAVQAYQSLVTAFDRDRKLAATAVFRLGECYRKLGKTNEAVLQYERIVREFADEATLATLSRQNLAGLRQLPVLGDIPVLTGLGNAAGEATRLAAQLRGIEQLQDNPEEQARAVLAFFPDETLKKMMLQIPKLKLQEAFLRANSEVGTSTTALYPKIRERGGWDTAFSPDGLEPERHGTNAVTDAQRELKKQLSWIKERVDFTVGVQKARLQVLQAGAGSSASPALTQAARLEQKRLLEEEIKVVEKKIEAEEARVKAGSLAPGDPSLYADRRDLLTLKRQLAALADEQLATPPRETAATDNEETEIRRLQAMIQNSPDLINGSGSGGMTPLCQAASKGQLRVVTFLLDHGAAIDRQGSGGSPLRHATSGGHKAVVELLLQRGADVNAKDGSGGTALHEAAASGFLSLAKVLVEHKADLNAHTSTINRERTPLYRAIEKGFPEMVAYLISKGADVNAGGADGMTPLMCAAAYGHPELLAPLLAAGAKPDLASKEAEVALNFAISSGQVDSVRNLLKAKVDPNAGQFSPLLQAIQAGNTAIVQRLLEAGADANRSGQLKQGVKTEPYTSPFPRTTFTPLSLAASGGNVEAVKLLLQHKADPNAVGSDGLPVILYGVVNAEVLKALLDAGARPNVDDGVGRTPLTTAVAGGRLDESVKLLLAHGADVNARCRDDRRTALHVAAAKGDTAIMKLLLAHKADVNALDEAGNTPLHWAVERGLKESAELLLDAKADANARNRVGQTPLDLARPGDPSLATLLRRHGAREGSPTPGPARPVGNGTNVTSRIYVSGEVRSPGAITLQPGEKLTVAKAIVRAGDCTDFANKKKVKVVRAGTGDGGKKQEFELNLTDILERGKTEQDIVLEAGDMVIVPRKLW